MKQDAHKSPFKFLDSFTQDDNEIFFGRDQEVEELYAKVFQSQLVLVYGASGTGKSSIINCGLANRFRNSDWLPINIRRGGNITASMYRQIAKESINQVAIDPEKKRTPEDFHVLLSSVFLDHFKPIYLIFDQFEELFIFGMEDEWREFIGTLHFLMKTDLDVHFIFVIRGEYLEFLSVFEDEIPDFFDNRVRIEKMTRRNAVQIINGPAKFYSIQLDEGFEENLLKKLSPDKAHIELTFLQVFLDKIYKKALEQQAEGKPLVLQNEHISSIGQIGDVLAEFVDEQIFKMDNPKAALTVLKAFVSLKGTKTQMSPDEIQRYTSNIGNPIAPNDIDSILSGLVNKRILKEKDENGKHELRHDSLAQKIYEKITHQERELLDVQQFLTYSLNEFKKRGILLNDEDLSYVGPFERTLKLDEETIEFIKVSKKNSAIRKKSRRTWTILTIIILILSVSSIAGFFYSQSQKRKAEELARIASNESLEARKQKDIAEQQKALALEQEQRAQQQATIAGTEREKAEAAREEALIQQSEAERQKQIADQQREQAQLARQDAEKNAQDAIQSKDVAETERQKAERLRLIGLVRELSIKSTYTSDRQLKALLALQALAFNQQYGGNSFNSDLHQALYLAKQSYATQGNSISSAHSLAITGIVNVGQTTISCGQDGKIIRSQLINGTVKSDQLVNSNHIFVSLALTDDKRRVLAGTQAGQIIIINTSNGKTESEKKLFDTAVVKIISTGRNELFVISADGTMTVLDAGGSTVKTIPLKEQLVDADIDISSGTLWAINAKNEMLAINNDGAASRVPIGSQGKAKKIALGKQGSIAIGFDNGTVGLWDISKSKMTQNLIGHNAAITDLQFDPTGNYLASASYDRSVRIWKLDQLQDQPIVIANHDSWISSIAFIDHNSIVTGTYAGTKTFISLDHETLASGLCDKIGRNLSSAEWQEYIGRDIKQTQTCPQR